MKSEESSACQWQYVNASKATRQRTSGAGRLPAGVARQHACVALQTDVWPAMAANFGAHISSHSAWHLVLGTRRLHLSGFELAA